MDASLHRKSEAKRIILPASGTRIACVRDHNDLLFVCDLRREYDWTCQPGVLYSDRNVSRGRLCTPFPGSHSYILSAQLDDSFVTLRLSVPL